MHRLPTLPPELWFKICTHLPPATLHSISQTCHCLHKVATSDQLFQHSHQKKYKAPLHVPATHTWRQIHSRTVTVARSPTYECCNSPIQIVPITDVADFLIVHIPMYRTLHALPNKWSLDLDFLHGDPLHAVALNDFRFALIDTVNPPNAVSPPRFHIIDSRTGLRRSYDLPIHSERLSQIPGTSAYLLPAQNFESLIYYAGVVRLVKISDLSTVDIRSNEILLLLGESPKPLIEGYANITNEGATVYTLRGEELIKIPLGIEEKLLTICTNAEKTSFTARIQRPTAIVALTKTASSQWWTHLHPTGTQTERHVHMFYNGNRTLLLPARDSPRMTVIQTHPVGGVQTIRAARVRGAPFDWGALSYGGDIVILCAKRVGVISLFDIDSGTCLQSVRFFRGKVKDVCFVGGAWIIGSRNEGCCVFEAWRFGKVGPMFGGVAELLRELEMSHSA